MEIKILKSKNVDAYIAKQVEAARPILNALREIIKTTIPKAEEEILWGYPFFKYCGILAGITAYKAHVSFQVADSLKIEDRKTLKEKGYTLGEKRIQIKFDQKVPVTEIKQIMKAQAKINETKKAMR
jgi:uncharacterized protein YdhG (YjbR/CyaY superfamily)